MAPRHLHNDARHKDTQKKETRLNNSQTQHNDTICSITLDTRHSA
jgi:hypothetical protein